MDNQMDNSNWNAPAVDQPPFPQDYYPLDQMSFLDGDIGSRIPEWLLSTKNGMGNASTSSDSPPYRPNMSTLPSSSAKKTPTAQRVGQTHTPRIDLASIVRSLMERVKTLEEKQRDMESQQARLVLWTLKVDGVQGKLAREVAEKTGVPIVEENEWAEVGEHSQA